MTTDEVGDNLLAQVQLVVDLVEYLLEVIELRERRLAHDMEHLVAGMFRSHLQASAHMLGNEFAGIFLRAAVDGRILALVKQEIVAHTAADETLLDARYGIYSMIDVEQRTVICIQVWIERQSGFEPVKVDGGQVEELTPYMEEERITLLVGKSEKNNITCKVQMVEGVTAPVEQGQTLGKLEYYCGDKLLHTVTLVAPCAVERVNFGFMFGKLLRTMLL